MLEADDDFRDAESTAAEALRIAVADADKLLEIDAADAWEQLMNELDAIGAEEVRAAADDKLEQAIGVAIDETVGYHAGTHTPDKPEPPTLPHVYSHAVDAVIEEDYARDDDCAYYEGAMLGGFYDSPCQCDAVLRLGAHPSPPVAAVVPDVVAGHEGCGAWLRRAARV